MITFPSAKINLGLNVVRKRTDGYHDIESIMVPIPLQDALEVVVDPLLDSNEVVYTRSGTPVPGDPEQDLCMRAIRLLQKDRELPGLRMHLHKNIPMGAGLGGGSSDGAQTLTLVNELLQLGHDRDALHHMAAALGSDCPFFLMNGICLSEGRGEKLSPIRMDLSGLTLLLVNPGLHVSTATVYANTTPNGKSMSFAEAAAGPRNTWQERLPNTMEAAVLNEWPAVGEIKSRLLQAGALYAAMSGSGSSVFGLFQGEAPAMNWPDTYRSWTIGL